ncbi:MAG: hypothetical protein IPL55_09990 [Saprospiraceae bacterium]|nr:hypothetical protein [Saprospiraceae bacterium]
MRRNIKSIFGIILFGIGSIYFLFNVPFLYYGFGNITDQLNKSDSIIYPITRSVILAFSQSFLILLISFIFSLFFRHITLESIQGRLMNIFILPFLIGSLSTCFIFKIILFNSSLLYESLLVQYVTLLIIQFWQYGTLFIYLFWLNYALTIKKDVEKVKLYNLNFKELLRDVIYPGQKNLLLLFFILCFILSYYESSKVFLLFKSSRGTNSELVSQWLNRLYQSSSLMNPETAFSISSGAGLFIFVLAIFSIFLGTFIFQKSISSLIHFFTTKKISLKFVTIIFYLSLLLIGAPFIIVFFTNLSKISVNIDLIRSILLSVIVAIATLTIAIFFSISTRIIWPNTLSKLNSKSMLFLYLYSFMIVLPPTIILISLFYWYKYVNFGSEFQLTILWILSQIVLAFPLANLFITISHLRIKNARLEYTQVIKLNFFEKVRDVFFAELGGDYIFILILTFSAVWNEYTVSSILSDVIPAFSNEINKAVLSKSADYTSAMSYLYFAIILGILSLFVWDRLLIKKINNYENKF